MAEPEHISGPINRIMDDLTKKQLEAEVPELKEINVAMGGRFILTGVQLGMIKAELKIIDSSIGGQKFKDVFDLLEEIHDNQYIGRSETEINDDVRDMTNLWASWIGKVHHEDEETFEKYFTLYWQDGRREVVKGVTIEAACTHAGYGQGAMKALDFYMNGHDTDYVWNPKSRNWDKKESNGKH